jgi:hypothetical protein
MFRVLARTITAAAVVFALVLSTDPGVVELDAVKCRTTRFKDKAATPPATGHQEVLSLMCGGNPGRLFGARTSMPATSGRLPLSSHGRPGTSGPVVETRMSLKSMRVFVENVGRVPWPNKRSIRALDLRKYRVYHMFAVQPNGREVAYKFGITRVGSSALGARLPDVGR